MRMTTRHQAAAQLLALGRSVTETAEQCRLTRRAIFRWLAESSEFRQLVTSCRDRLFAEAASRITAQLGDVSSTLVELTKAQSEYVRVKAARALAELGLRLRKDLEIEGRLQDVERQLQLSSEGGAP